MNWFYRNVVRSCLFTRPPEAIHEFTVHSLRTLSRYASACQALGTILRPAPLPVQAFGLHFPNPIGLAAGMDKNGEALAAWEAMGFGFNEIGAVTWYPQPGNPTPRVFRIVADQAIINRMGFNNVGAEAMARVLQQCRNHKRWPAHPIGINLGKSKVTPLAEAAQDYAKSFATLWPFADFFVLNVSSPNTPDLRRLQDKQALDDILSALQEINAQSAAQSTSAASAPPPTAATPQARWKPILVKVAPDLTWEALDQILELVAPRAIAGLIATNTTITRPQNPPPHLQSVYAEAGGLSGRPLRQRSTEVIRHLYRQTRGSLPIIGVGGVFSAADAWEKVAAGATLIQVYTGLVYEGPGLVRSLVNGLRQRLAEAQIPDWQTAVGCESK